ncbi:formylglycine-generating enzyme family protein [Ramlibacter tataouinensis]|nr:formylglycine-generating enzyme family protein [Ramlibacter tataouinensis]
MACPTHRLPLAGLAGVLLALPASAAAQDMQPVGRFEIDRTEVTIGQFRRFAEATGTVTAAERAGGGSTYEGGWQQRRGWTWRAPFGSPGGEREPAVHLNYREAEAFCRWAGKRLPTDSEWGEAAYVERRAQPPSGFVTGRRYPYPTGESPRGANCLAGDCGEVRTVPHAVSSRGRGHAEAGTTRAGVNGLFEMGGNAWEWVDSGPGPEKRTRGGSWWYGAQAMRDEHIQGKPFDTAVVYIGLRCARDR